MVNATLRAGIDSRGAQQGATVFQRATTNMRQAARLASQAIGRLDGSAKNLGSRLSTTARSIAVLQGPLGAISGRFTALGSLISSVGFKVAAFGIALAGLSVTASKSVSAFTVFERQTVTIEQVIRTTGGAAGRTAEQIEALSREIGLSTLASTGDVREAAAQLLTFRSIAGETFDETLRLANDVAALGFTNLKGATLQLAKAIEQPAIGLTALRRSGVDFSKSLIEVIKRLSETGRRAEATNLILAGVRKQVAGVGAAQGRTLAGAFDTLSEETTFLLERWGELISDGVNLKGKLDSLTGSVRLLHRATNELQEVDLLPGGIRRFLADLGLANRGGPIPRIATTVGELRNAVDPPGSRPAPQEPTDRATASTVKLTRAFEDNARAALLQRRALDEANRKLREAEELGNAVAGSLDKAFDEFLETGRVNFKSFVDSILKDIARIAFQQAITRPLANAIGSSLGNATAGPGGGGVLGRLFNFGGARAAGGPVSRGRAYLVGEGGPEMFVPRQNGTIVPNGAGVNVSVNVISPPGTTGREVGRQETGDGLSIDVLIEQVDSALGQRVSEGRSSTGAAVQSRFGLSPGSGAR